ncbi:ParA family protein [Lutispora thermophila]|uniref:Sporulation initiation inhibitor protein Soj n=1 Tax=Lutispora thermophila DSM 19022 TaxID=1122184 RepID=A0A1M6J4Q4_9FIRM|nr:ParA family protein [Lutispora thermophila]SHJ41633.1 chromosome partitioning protein [Lutispora thermophila DSM 19022]
MRKIAFTNQKGGTGKSTSCINIGAILGNMGYKVLVIDLDPQGNCTQGFGLKESDIQLKPSIYDVLVNEKPIEEAIISTEYKNVDVVSSYIVLANAELELASAMSRETILQQAIIESSMDYDYILFDLPPNLGLLTLNGLAAANEVIIPVDVGVFAISGINQLVKVINMVKRKINQQLSITGILLTKVDGRTNLSKEIHSSLADIFGDKLFKNVVHINVKIAEAQKEQKPVFYYDKDCRGTIEYKLITEEIVDRVKVI